MTDWSKIRQLLIDRRKLLRLGQREVAARMGTTQSVISDWESGKVESPNLDALSRWANALEIDLDVVLTLREIVIPATTTRITLKPRT